MAVAAVVYWFSAIWDALFSKDSAVIVEFIHGVCRRRRLSLFICHLSVIFISLLCQMVPAMNGSPKPCYPLRHSHQWSFESPSIVQLETSFRKVHVQTSQTMIMKNYDGSEVAKTVTRHRDGIETIVELTTYPDSKVLLREFVKNLASGKSRKYVPLSNFHVLYM